MHGRSEFFEKKNYPKNGENRHKEIGIFEFIEKLDIIFPEFDL